MNAMSTAAPEPESTRFPARVTCQDVLDAPAHRVDESISIRPFDATTFSLGDLWP